MLTNKTNSAVDPSEQLKQMDLLKRETVNHGRAEACCAVQINPNQQTD